MDWLHSYGTLRRHPKTRKLARLLDVSVPQAVGHLHCLWWWSMEYAPDGDLTDMEPDVIADAAAWDGDPEALIDALLSATKEKGGPGFLENNGRLVIHDHEEYIGRYLDKAAKDAARKRRERADRAQDAGTPPTDHPDDGLGTSSGHPMDGAGRKKEEKEEREERERTPPTPPAAPKPVDNEEDKSGVLSEITLTQGQRAIVDADDFERLSGYSWYAIKSGDGFYAAAKVKGGVLLMHRFILGLGIDRDGIDVHHKNGDGLDNRKKNLKRLNRSEHMLVHNSAKPERGCSIEPEEPGPEPQSVTTGDTVAASKVTTTAKPETCDGKPCLAHDFPAGAFAPLRRAMLASLHPEQQKEVGAGGALDDLMESYAAHVCAACQASLGEFERPQRDALCEQAVVAAVQSLHGSHDVAAVMKSRLLRFGLAELIGDRTLEELRRTKRDKRRKGEPRPLGNPLEVAS